MHCLGFGNVLSPASATLLYYVEAKDIIYLSMSETIHLIPDDKNHTTCISSDEDTVWEDSRCRH